MEESWKTAHGDLLSTLSPQELAWLVRNAKRRRISRGQRIFEAGEDSGEILIVVGGCIKLYQLSPGGKEIILWFAFPGELFGVAESIRGVPREISASAKVASEVMSIERRDFVEFLRLHPEASLRAIGILSARVRTLGSAFAELMADDVETRLSRLLLRFSAGSLTPACAAPCKPGEMCLNIDLTRSDIANFVGATRQTVTTLLARLQRNGIVRPVARHFHLVAPAQLARIYERRISER